MAQAPPAQNPFIDPFTGAITDIQGFLRYLSETQGGRSQLFREGLEGEASYQNAPSSIRSFLASRFNPLEAQYLARGVSEPGTGLGNFADFSRGAAGGISGDDWRGLLGGITDQFGGVDSQAGYDSLSGPAAAAYDVLRKRGLDVFRQGIQANLNPVLSRAAGNVLDQRWRNYSRAEAGAPSNQFDFLRQQLPGWQSVLGIGDLPSVIPPSSRQPQPTPQPTPQTGPDDIPTDYFGRLPPGPAPQPTPPATQPTTPPATLVPDAADRVETIPPNVPLPTVPPANVEPETNPLIPGPLPAAPSPTPQPRPEDPADRLEALLGQLPSLDQQQVRPTVSTPSPTPQPVPDPADRLEALLGQQQPAAQNPFTPVPDPADRLEALLGQLPSIDQQQGGRPVPNPLVEPPTTLGSVDRPLTPRPKPKPRPKPVYRPPAPAVSPGGVNFRPTGPFAEGIPAPRPPAPQVRPPNVEPETNPLIQRPRPPQRPVFRPSGPFLL